MMKRASQWILAIGLIAGLAGCSSTAGIEGSTTAVRDAEGNTSYSNMMVVNNPKLAGKIQISDIQTEFVGGLMKTQVDLISKYSKNVSVKYKFSWFDADGMEIDSDASAWTPLTLYGNESKTVQGVAPNPTARKFKIKIR
jgi:uncharacterized protein YcfL